MLLSYGALESVDSSGLVPDQMEAGGNARRECWLSSCLRICKFRARESRKRTQNALGAGLGSRGHMKLGPRSRKRRY